MVSIVVAHASNRVIGSGGGLPWRLPADLRRFRELTVGGTVLMGRRTFQSLPEAFRPLPQRRNLVLSSDSGYHAPGAEVFDSLEAALAACEGECFVIGGGVTYREALPLCARLYATEVETAPPGDVFFPELDTGQWRRVERSERFVQDEIGFTFNVYERAGSAL